MRFFCGPAGGQRDWVALIGVEQQGSPSIKVTATLVVGRKLAYSSLPRTNPEEAAWPHRPQNNLREMGKQQQQEAGENVSFF